jgi:hypothetical protein
MLTDVKLNINPFKINTNFFHITERYHSRQQNSCLPTNASQLEKERKYRCTYLPFQKLSIHLVKKNGRGRVIDLGMNGNTITKIRIQSKNRSMGD